MKTAIASLVRTRAAHASSLVLLVLMVALIVPASAQTTRAANWPTTEWVVMNEPPRGAKYHDYALADLVPPQGQRADLAEKHRKILEAASIWFQSLGFAAPLQRTEDYDLEVEPGEAYRALLKHSPKGVGSAHDVHGRMMLTSNPEFLTADTQVWELMEASGVHELFHAIQGSENLDLLLEDIHRNKVGLMLAECPGDTNLDWLVEGTAAMVQVRWLEQTRGVTWGHPFKGSLRPGWVRHFDQSLAEGSLPPEHRDRGPRPAMTERHSVSWACDYGTWYFWYAVGEMIGRDDIERVTYTRHILRAGEPWYDAGIANVDIGLKAAAAAYDAIKPYRGGLHDLYPQFVAQYLDDDRFYGEIETVELGTPGLYETTSSLSGGPLEPIASRAWRVRVQVPPEMSSIPYNVRFTLDAPEGTRRDDLHLIVDRTLATRPDDALTPYTHLEKIGGTAATATGAVEYLVRVANVAEKAAETTDAEFSLRIEVQGFYGEDVSGGPETGGIAGELPPGFAVRGPGLWSCSGDANSQAIFDLVTPEEAGRDIAQAIPDIANSMEGVADKLDIMVQMAQREEMLDRDAGEQFHAQIAEGRAALESARNAPRPDMAAAADEARAKGTTRVAATFVGSNGGEMCQMTLKATLQGRQGGAQIVAHAVDEDLYPDDEAPRFDVAVFPKVFFEAMRGRAKYPDAWDSWQVCAMTAEEQQDARRDAARKGCPAFVCNAGQLTLEKAGQGRIAGTFQFEVRTYAHEYDRCKTPLGRDTVVGHFNVTSTDDGHDDNGLTGGIAAGIRGASMARPGAPMFNVDED